MVLITFAKICLNIFKVNFTMYRTTFYTTLLLSSIHQVLQYIYEHGLVCYYKCALRIMTDNVQEYMMNR